jgi:hypothetical protein
MDVMTFGRHRGDPACDVPLRYLVWAMESMASPPACVVDELRRRAGRYGSRDGVAAQAALSGLAFKGRRKAAKKLRNRKAASTATHAGERVGDQYAERRAEWLAGGGSDASCPWDE